MSTRKTSRPSASGESDNFTPQNVRAYMPDARKRTALQILKRFKNKCIKMVIETAKNNRYGCTFTLHTFEVDLPLQYNLEETTQKLQRWLLRKGFGAVIEPDDPNSINITWAEEGDEEFLQEAWQPLKPRAPQRQTIGMSIPIHQPPAPGAAPGVPLDGVPSTHAWNTFMD